MTKPMMIPVPQTIAQRYVRKLADVIDQMRPGDDVAWELGCIAQDLQARITREEDRLMAEEEGPMCGTPGNKMQAIKELRKESAFINKLLNALGINKSLVFAGYDFFSAATTFTNQHKELIAKAAIQPDWLAEGSSELEAFEAKQNKEFAEGMEWLRRDVLEHLAQCKKAWAIDQLAYDQGL